MMTLIADCFGKQQYFCLLDTIPDIKAGSMPGNQVYLPFKGVSRQHFSLIKRDSGWVLRDLASRNGTYLNGKKIGEAAIHPGDEIRAGIVKLRLQEASQDSGTILLHDQDRPRRKRDTEEVLDGVTPGDEGFYFPQLVFPEGMIVGSSAPILEIYGKLHSIASSEVNVLFIGETGSGKEMLAQTLHLSGPRAHGPFVAVNCAAIPADLAESELFGIGEKVATNVNRRAGKMVLAHRGTLLLDELSSFAMSLQAKVLRALEEKIVYPVGDNTAHPADFRVMATSNEDPKELIRSGRLREDLYHRIAAVEVTVPPLRQRKEDIEPLVLGLLAQLSARENKAVPGIRRDVLEMLRQYSYPGNVRELSNIVKSMVALANPGEILDVALLPEKVRHPGEMTGSVPASGLTQEPLRLHAHLDDVTRTLVQQALAIKGGNITRAAQHLGITPRGLRKMMQRLGLDHP